MDDFELLEAYASRRAEDAFTELTSRYINLVYSAALRQTSNAQSAEDITQAVFLTLARKAGSISPKTILCGWLLRTTRFAAANARRLEQRRHHYEQQLMGATSNDSEDTWQRIAPVLDEALDQLGERDRDAILLRFFEQRPLKQVAQELGTSEDGAQKRVSRALEKLRAYVVRHGKAVSAAGLAGALATRSIEAAPGSLSTAISLLVRAKSIGASAPVEALARITLRSLERARSQIIAIRAGSIAVLVMVTGVTLVRVSSTAPSNKAPLLIATEDSKPGSQNIPQAQASPGAVVAAGASIPAGNKELLLHIADSQSGAPVTNARLTLVSVVASSRRSTNTFFTDSLGSSPITYSAVAVRSWSHRIEIFRDGYVPKYVSWSEFQQDRIEEIPLEYTAKLDPAVTIGGLVLDEKEASVPGMRVVFSVSGASPGASSARERLTMMGDYHFELTDPEGRWRCNHVPARFGMIDYKLVHPQFQEITYASDSADSPAYNNIERIAVADLLAQRAVLRVKPGLTIGGSVVDENGLPIAAAKITQSFDFNRPDRNAFTEANGSFHFGNGRPRELPLTIQASGFAPVVTSLVLKVSIDTLRFTLPVGRKLEARVVDMAEQPISGATVQAASPSADSRTLFEWRTKTDREGYFVWEAAPGRQEYAVSASGYELQQRITLAAEVPNQIVRLQKNKTSPIRISGQILDADTKMPPPSARVQIWETTVEANGGWSTFTTRPVDTPPDGTFRLKTASGTRSYVLEAQADGYWPERVTNKVSGAKEVQVTMEVRKAPAHGGQVITPAGQPAAGATLVVCGPQEWALMNQAGKLQFGASSTVAGTVSDGEGRFQLPCKYAAEMVVVAHEEGFTELPFANMRSNTLVTLKPWGRIEGTARVGQRALAGATIRLNGRMWQSPRVSPYVSSETDEDGHFLFESVPPGEWKVEHEVNPHKATELGLHFPTYSHAVLVVVHAGETARVTLGGSGRALIGKAVIPDPIASFSWTENVVTLTRKIANSTAPQLPKRQSFTSDEAYHEALTNFGEQSRAYWRSEEGIALQRLQRQYCGLFAPDGSFRIDDIPAGEYTLTINLSAPPKERSNLAKPTPIASLVQDIAIEEAIGEAGPFNVGELYLTPAPLAQTGK